MQAVDARIRYQEGVPDPYYGGARYSSTPPLHSMYTDQRRNARHHQYDDDEFDDLDETSSEMSETSEEGRWEREQEELERRLDAMEAESYVVSPPSPSPPIKETTIPIVSETMVMQRGNVEDGDVETVPFKGDQGDKEEKSGGVGGGGEEEEDTIALTELAMMLQSLVNSAHASASSSNSEQTELGKKMNIDGNEVDGAAASSLVEGASSLVEGGALCKNGNDATEGSGGDHGKCGAAPLSSPVPVPECVPEFTWKVGSAAIGSMATTVPSSSFTKTTSPMEAAESPPCVSCPATGPNATNGDVPKDDVFSSYSSSSSSTLRWNREWSRAKRGDCDSSVASPTEGNHDTKESSVKESMNEEENTQSVSTDRQESDAKNAKFFEQFEVACAQAPPIGCEQLVIGAPRRLVLVVNVPHAMLWLLAIFGTAALILSMQCEACTCGMENARNYADATLQALSSTLAGTRDFVSSFLPTLNSVGGDSVDGVGCEFVTDLGECVTLPS